MLYYQLLGFEVVESRNKIKPHKLVENEIETTKHIW